MQIPVRTYTDDADDVNCNDGSEEKIGLSFCEQDNQSKNNISVFTNFCLE